MPFSLNTFVKFRLIVVKSGVRVTAVFLMNASQARCVPNEVVLVIEEF